MSFLYINDPKNRDRIVTEYLASLKKTKQSANLKDEVSLGDEIQFLPGDIKGLQTKLTYLLGEYRAGNTAATHNQIVAVADELLRRGKISKEEYHKINCEINENL